MDGLNLEIDALVGPALDLLATAERDGDPVAARAAVGLLAQAYDLAPGHSGAPGLAMLIAEWEGELAQADLGSWDSVVLWWRRGWPAPRPGGRPSLSIAELDAMEGALHGERYVNGRDPAERDAAMRLLAPLADAGKLGPQDLLGYAALLIVWYEQDAVPAARDTALDLLAPMVTAGTADPGIVADYAELVFDRAEQSGTTRDWAQAVHWLRESLRIGGAQNVADTWDSLGHAYWAWSRLDDDDALFDEAVDCFTAAVRHGQPAELLAPAALVFVADRLREQRRSAGGVDDALLADIRAVLALADQIVDRPELDTEIRATVAMEILTLQYLIVDGNEITRRLVQEGLEAFPLAGDRFDRLLGYADAHPDPPQGWSSSRAAMRAMTSLLRAMFGTGPRPGADFGLQHAAEAMRTAEHSDDAAALFSLISAVAGGFSGDLGRVKAAEQLVGTSADPSATAISLFARLGQMLLVGMPADGARTAVELLSVLARSLAQVLGGGLRGRLQPPAADTGKPGHLIEVSQYLDVSRRLDVGQLREIADVFAAFPGCDALVAQAAAAEVIAGIIAATSAGAPADRLAELRARLADADQAWADSSAQLPPPPRAMGTQLFAHGWQLFAGVTGDRSAARLAVARSQAVLDWFDGPDHPMWPMVVMTAARARRLRGEPGDLPGGRRLALRALRGHAWLVLLQSGTRDALEVARGAAADARVVLEWCVEDLRGGDEQARDDLVTAVEAGRGLVLHAAVTTRSAAEQLRELGHADLAQAWAAAGLEPAEADPAAQGPGWFADGAERSALRRAVLAALSESAAGPDSLLLPPSIGEIRAAVGTHGSDALVYLVPGVDRPGHIIIIPADGTRPVEHVEHPGLVSADDSPMGRYLAAYAGWRQAAGGEGARQGVAEPAAAFAASRAALAAWRAALAELTEWAGRIAEVLLDRVSAVAADTTWPTFVITSVGVLGLVPWHAAVLDVEAPGHQTGGGTRLAQRATVSYIPSARLLCRTVAM
ncbi:hypothetical protein KBI5_15205, partial [Frankia sp. KB5]